MVMERPVVNFRALMNCGSEQEDHVRLNIAWHMVWLPSFVFIH